MFCLLKLLNGKCTIEILLVANFQLVNFVLSLEII